MNRRHRVLRSAIAAAATVAAGVLTGWMAKAVSAPEQALGESPPRRR